MVVCNHISLCHYTNIFEKCTHTHTHNSFLLTHNSIQSILFKTKMPTPIHDTARAVVPWSPTMGRMSEELLRIESRENHGAVNIRQRYPGLFANRSSTGSNQETVG